MHGTIDVRAIKYFDKRSIYILFSFASLVQLQKSFVQLVLLVFQEFAFKKCGR